MSLNRERLNRYGIIPAACCVVVVDSIVRVQSFPHAFSGNPGEIRTGPPIKTFGGDNLRKSHPRAS